MSELLVDARGLLCPMPVIELARRIRGINVGGLIRVLADDPAAVADLPAWCTMRGHEFLGSPEPGTYLVRRIH